MRIKYPNKKENPWHGLWWGLVLLLPGVPALLCIAAGYLWLQYNLPPLVTFRLAVDWAGQAVDHAAWVADADYLRHYELLLPFVAVMYLIRDGAAIFLAGGLVWGMAHPKWINSPLKHESGPQLRPPPEGEKAAKRIYAAEIKRQGTAVQLCPGVRLPREHEAKGVLAIGRPGSGKTVFIRYWLNQIMDMPDAQAVVLCVKGDVVSKWPTADFVLLAPHDNRVHADSATDYAKAWDISLDLDDSPQAAQEFAAAMVPEGKEAMWAKGGHAIIAGVIKGLYTEHYRSDLRRSTWTWRDLAEQLAIDGQEMEQYLEKHYPEAMYYTATDENGNYTKTSLSFIVNVLSAMRELVSPLAAAWGAVPVSRRISLRQWALARKEGQARTLIVQWSGEFASMGTAWISAALRFLNSITTHSPMYGESATRRLFFVLDELPRIAREGDGLAELLDVGRSKGICLLAGVQNIEQLTKRWGEEVTDAVLGNCGTVIFGQLGNVGKSDVGAGRAAEMVGKVIWSEKDETTNPKTGRIKIRWRPQNPKLLVEANFFETLGPTSRGVVMALRKGTDLCMLTWPYDNWTTRRPAVVPAAWIKGWTKDVDTEEWAKRRKLARSVAMRELAGYEAAERAIAVCRRHARGRKLFATTAAGATSFAAGLGVVAALYLANPPAVNDWATVSVGAVLFDARTGQQMRQVITPGARVQLQVRTRSGGAWVVAVPNYGQVMIQRQFLHRALPLAMPWEGV